MINPSRILVGDRAAECKRVDMPFDFASEAVVIFEDCTVLRKRKGLQNLRSSGTAGIE